MKKLLMVDIDSFKQLALSFPDAAAMPHFEKQSYRIKNKIFATLDIAHERVCLKLSLADQSVFCALYEAIIYPVNNKWGKQGWTFVELKHIKKKLLKDVLSKAYFTVAATKKLPKIKPL